jgi:tRNA-splicing ligase RtcB
MFCRHVEFREVFVEFEAVEKITDLTWQVAPSGSMQVPVVVVADAPLIADMDDKTLEQARNVATLPGIVRASYVMPDGHWGYGFPIGGVAAFDADAGGVVSAGGVGFDISCGVRCLLTGLEVEEVQAVDRRLAEALFRRIPAGVGSTARVRLREHELEAMLRGGAAWAIEQGWGQPRDLDRIEDRGCIPDAQPQFVSARARLRQRDEMGTLGSGSHYLEVQRITEIFAPDVAHRLGLFLDDVVVSIHCGSRGLGHQIGTDYLREMGRAAESFGLRLPDRELASAPIHSELGQRYLGAMRAGSNCALANRQIPPK